MLSWDKSQLPKPTRDPDKVVNDIDRWGYGLLEDALSEPLLTKTKTRLLEQAAAELKAGFASKFARKPKKFRILFVRRVPQQELNEI